MADEGDGVLAKLTFALLVLGLIVAGLAWREARKSNQRELARILFG
jgi:hypothetical protein